MQFSTFCRAMSTARSAALIRSFGERDLRLEARDGRLGVVECLLAHELARAEILVSLEGAARVREPHLEILERRDGDGAFGLGRAERGDRVDVVETGEHLPGGRLASPRR